MSFASNKLLISTIYELDSFSPYFIEPLNVVFSYTFDFYVHQNFLFLSSNENITFVHM